jgi:hypothetical protein
MNTLIWVAAIIVLQGVVAAIAKKAQENAEAARRANAGRAPAQPTSGDAVVAGERPQGRTIVKTRADKPRAAAKPKSTPKSTPKSPAPMRPSSHGRVIGAPPEPQRGGDSADALLSRKHVAESVAKIRAVEAKVAAGLPGVEIAKLRSTAVSHPGFGVAELARALRNPTQVRQALILGEVLGKPRCMAP